MSTRYYQTHNDWNIRARRYPHDRSYIAWASKEDINTSAGPLDCGGGADVRVAFGKTLQEAVDKLKVELNKDI
jgi:hypothetical protein